MGMAAPREEDDEPATAAPAAAADGGADARDADGGEDDAMDDDYPAELMGEEREVEPTLQAVLAAAEEGDVRTLRAALRHAAVPLDGLGEDGDTALHLAALYGHKDCVQLLLEAGAPTIARDEDGALPLHDACASGFLEIAEMLLDTARGDVRQEQMINAADNDGDTPLHNAARAGNTDVVEMLLVRGANPLAKNAQGQTPLNLSDGEKDVEALLRAAEERLSNPA